jgi:uncharacterized membrane protein
MIVLAAAIAVARIFRPWRDAVRIGLVVMLFFTAVAHFAPALKHDLAAMIPPPFTGNMAIIYLTGVLEIAGAVGLLIPRYRRAAAIGLVLLLLGMFPANVYAALSGVTLRGQPATELWLRTPMQIVWIAMLWWSSIRRPSTRESAPLPSPA